MTAPLRVGVVGLGFMGRTHLAAYVRAARDGLPVRLCAVCDRGADGDWRERLGAAAGNLSPGSRGADGGVSREELGGVRFFTDAAEMLATPADQGGVDAVSVCTYTDTHAPLAVAALRAGKHALVEKPVAVTAEGVRPVLEAARAAAGLRCVPAMCVRFWPGWDWVRERVRDGSLGRVRGAALERMGAGPTWGAEFYRDEERCGGALVDLHVHDTDFLCWLFGPPREVTSVGSLRHVTTLYRWGESGGAGLASGVPVSAEGAWGLPQAAGFRMRFRVAFERAWAEFDLARERPLRVFGEDGAPLEGAPTGAGEDGLSAYDLQVRHFVALCTGREHTPRASIEDALIAARVLDAERESLRTGRAVTVGA